MAEPDRTEALWAIINDRGGVRFDEFLDLVLYDPRFGFYANEGRSGRRGAFITSPTVGGLFGRCVASYLDELWDRAGRPKHWSFVDLGAGTGALARSVIAAAPRCGGVLNVHLVERSDRQRTDAQDLVRWAGERGVDVSISSDGSGYPPASVAGLVLGNYLLDNLAWNVRTGTGADANELWVLGDRSLSWKPPALPADGHSGFSEPFPDQRRASSMVAEWLERIDTGAVVFIDYGTRTTAELLGRDGWLRTYRDHEVGTDPLEQIGYRDITADVAFDQLPSGASLCTQSEAMEAWGIVGLVDAARVAVDRLASVGNLEWARARSVLTEAAALTDPHGLGGFLVASWEIGALYEG